MNPPGIFLAKRLFNLYPIHIIGLVSSIVVVSLMHWLAIPPRGARRQRPFRHLRQ
ncbi:hypothetical protein DZS_29040 [Dickeya ananatis]